MYGLIQAANSLDRNSRAGIDVAAQNEQRREMAEKQLDQAERAGRTSAIATGAGAGAAFGPVGAVAGGAIGWLTYELF